MRKVLAALSCALAALALAGVAGAATIFGVNEDQPRFANDAGAATYGQLQDVGMTENVISVKWDPAAPTAIDAADRVTRAIAAGAARGVKVVIAIYPGKARAVADGGRDGFVNFCGQVAAAFPGAAAFIVGNEPNQPRFWQPQFNADGSQASAAAFADVLAGCYDKIHPLGKPVIGVGLSPRGNDNPTAKDNISTSPVRFIAALGAAYRKSGRTTPIMDAFSFHPYPNLNTDAPTVGYKWPNAGVPNYDRIKQVFYDAFNGTAQPHFESGLLLWLDEVGWQVDTAGRPGYAGNENVPTVDEAKQADYHAQTIRLAACDPLVATLHFFHWVDESDRDRFQSGELRVDGAQRPAYGAVKQAIADTAGGTRCPGTPVSWRHTDSVVNASAEFGNVAAKPAAQTKFAFSASADENAGAVYALVRVDDATALTAAEKAAIQTALKAERSVSSVRATPELAVSKQSLVKAYFHPRLELDATDLDRAYYVYAVLLSAETNASRTAFFVSTPFQAGKGALASGGGATAVTATTSPAARVLLESALLRGSVKAPKGTKVEAWFEYGPGTILAKRTKTVSFVGGDPTVSAQVQKLSPRAQWSYRLVARIRGNVASADQGATRAFTLAKPASRTLPLVVVEDVDEQRTGVQVDAIVSATGQVEVALKVRRLPSAGKRGDAAFRSVDSASRNTGLAGEDMFLPLAGPNLAPGRYLGQVVATNRGRSVVRVFRFTIR